MYLNSAISHLFKWNYIGCLLDGVLIDIPVLLITFKAINGLAPLYLSDLVSIKSSTYSLQTNNSKILSVPPVKGKKTIGDRSFMLAAPKVWNDLHKDLHFS